MMEANVQKSYRKKTDPRTVYSVNQANILKISQVKQIVPSDISRQKSCNPGQEQQIERTKIEVY